MKVDAIIIGGGLMGAGLAQVFAENGCDVALYEPIDAARETVLARITENIRQIGGDVAAVDKVSVSDDLEAVVATASFVTEAAPEKLELKRSMFADFERYAPRDAILASNTSVIPITRITNELETAERMIGTHLSLIHI